MESRCSLIRGNVTDKTWASRYMSSPAIQQLLLPDFIVSLVHKSQLPRRARPRRPAPTIIKIELSLIELSRFSPEYFGCFCLCAFVWMSIDSHTTFLLLFSFHLPVSAEIKCSWRQTYNDLQKKKKKKKTKHFSFGEIVHFLRSLSWIWKKKSVDIHSLKNCSCAMYREAHLHYIVATVFVLVILKRISQTSKIVVRTQSLMWSGLQSDIVRL